MAKKATTRKTSGKITTKRKSTRRPSIKKGDKDLRSYVMFIAAFVLIALFLAMILSNYWTKYY